MTLNPMFAIDCSPWHQFVVESVAKSKTCEVKGWMSMAKSVAPLFLCKFMEQVDSAPPKKS